MPVSFKHLGRNVTLAALTASALAVGTATAYAAPAPVSATAPVSVSTDMATRSVTATLTSGHFTADAAAHSIEVVNARGAATESIPLTVRGAAVPVAATISPDGRSLTLTAAPARVAASAPVGGLVKASTTDSLNTLIGQWMWGVEHGGGVGAVIGGLVGCVFLDFLGCLPGAVPGAALGGALTSPNAGQINATFNDLIGGR